MARAISCCEIAFAAHWDVAAREPDAMSRDLKWHPIRKELPAVWRRVS
jgi:hypothetical protein